MKPVDTDQQAQVVVNSPRQLSQFMSDPDRFVQKAIPGDLKTLLLGREELERQRAELRSKVREGINEKPELKIREELELERERFFRDAMENPQRTFDLILRMSVTTFVIGILLIGGAVAAALLGQDTLQKAIIGGLSGTGGLIATVFAVFTLTNDSIRKANGDNAQIRAILHSYAAQSMAIRIGASSGSLDPASLADKLHEVTLRTVELIETRTEPTRDPGAHAHPALAHSS